MTKLFGDKKEQNIILFTTLLDPIQNECLTLLRLNYKELHFELLMLFLITFLKYYFPP